MMGRDKPFPYCNEIATKNKDMNARKGVFRIPGQSLKRDWADTGRFSKEQL